MGSTKGKAKEKLGDSSGNERMKREGQAEQGKAKVKGGADKVKKDADKTAGRVKKA